MIHIAVFVDYALTANNFFVFKRHKYIVALGLEHWIYQSVDEHTIRPALLKCSNW